MRSSLMFFLTLFCISEIYATDVIVKKIDQNGSSSYRVQIGPVSNQKEAEALKTTLSTAHPQPFAIQKPEGKSFYLLSTSALKDEKAAQDLQASIQQTLQKNPTIQTHTEKLEAKVWNLRNADIRAVIDEVSRVTGKNFLIDSRVQGKISIVSATPLTDKELYPVFLSMLQISGYTAIPSNDVVKIIPSVEARSQTSDLLSQLKNPSHGDAYMVEVVPVRYVPAEQLVPALRPLMPQWSQVSAYAPSNMLILSGPANKIQQLSHIIKQVDTSSANGIDMVPLKHALAMDIVNTLKDLLKSQPQSGLHAQTMLAADDRNNAILISGNRTERIRLRLLINQLDKESPYGNNSNTQVIYLSYLRAEDLVPILAGIAQASFSGTVGTTIGTITRPSLDSTNPASSFADGSSSGGYTAAASANPDIAPDTSGAKTESEGSTKPSVQIIAEPNTNSIIINAPVTLIRMLKNVVSQLDIKPAQILIEALVAEINESDIKRLGIEWGSINQKTLDPNSFRPGFAVLNGKTTLDQFQAQIHALAEQKRANILSTPSVVVLDNRQAKILIGKQLSVATTSFPNNADGKTTASPFTTFDRVNVALHLYVRPQITRGDGIQMQIDQGNDTLDPSTVNNTDNPVFNISAIVTSVHVDSGNILILGGLKQDSLANDSNRLSILGDVPGIGQLFQRHNTNREKKILMVFIRPCILRTEQDEIQVTGSKYYDVRREQLDALRKVETFSQDNQDVVLPPLHQAGLPKPFSHPVKPPAILTK